MNTFLVKLLLPFRGLFTSMGVDFDQLEAIVKVKLMMDNRRQIVSYRRKENTQPANSFVMTLFFYTLFGAFIAIGIASIPSFILSMTLFFSYVMVMIAMTLITDFSSILLDTSDNTIILPRPVSSRTLFVSRLVHIFLYLGQIMIGLVLVPAVVIWFKYSVLIVFCFLVGTTLAVITGVFVTNAFYLLILQFASEEKLRTVINYFQIVMAVAVMASYQILPRLLGRFDLDDYEFVISTWHFFVPPVWIAAAMEAIYYHLVDAPHVIMSTMALALPPAGIYIVNKYLTPVFARKLGVMGVDTTPQKERRENETFVGKISKRIVTGPLERGAFELVYNLLSRDRKLKLKIYPSIGYILIFGIIFLMRDRQSFASTWQQLPETDYFLVLIYLAFMLLQIAAFEIPYSDDFKASWIYTAAPLEKPGEILTATLKALVVRLFIPVYFGLSLIVVAIWGMRVVDDVVFGLLNNLVMLMIIVLINKRQLPFSVAPNARNQSGNFIRSLMMMLLISTVGLSHYLLTHLPVFMLVAIPLQAILLYVLYRRYRNTSWSEISL